MPNRPSNELIPTPTYISFKLLPNINGIMAVSSKIITIINMHISPTLFLRNRVTVQILIPVQQYNYETCKKNCDKGCTRRVMRKGEVFNAVLNILYDYFNCFQKFKSQ